MKTPDFPARDIIYIETISKYKKFSYHESCYIFCVIPTKNLMKFKFNWIFCYSKCVTPLHQEPQKYSTVCQQVFLRKTSTLLFGKVMHEPSRKKGGKQNAQTLYKNIPNTRTRSNSCHWCFNFACKLSRTPNFSHSRPKFFGPAVY